MEKFTKQIHINTLNQPSQETQENKDKKRMDKKTPFLKEEAQMYTSISMAIENKTDEPEKEGRMRKIRKAIAGGVGLTLLAGSMAMGVPSAHGGERSKGKTSIEYIEKKETKEDEKNPLYMAGVEMANTMYLNTKGKNEDGKPSLSADQLSKYLEISPIYLKGFLDSWKKFDTEYDDQEKWEESIKSTSYEDRERLAESIKKIHRGRRSEKMGRIYGRGSKKLNNKKNKII